MAVTLNANTSTGFIATSDTSGILQLQTAGTTALAVSAAQVVTLTNPLPVASGGSGGTTSTGTGANVLGTTPSFTSTIGVGNATPAASGAGITFPATQSASSNANTLDDYEEGSWSPTLTFGGATTGITYAQQTGSYIKVGQMVFVSGRIDLSNKGSATGAADIRSLPFTISAVGAGSVGFQRSAAPSNKQVMLTFDTSTSFIIRYSNGVTTSQSTDTEFANDTILIFSATYCVTA